MRVAGACAGLLLLLAPARLAAEQADRIARFLAGGLVGFAAHESGHLVLDLAFDAQPHVKHVEFGIVPFFAIAHRNGLPPRQEYAISAAGFWVQGATAEWILSRRPGLRGEPAPFAKGVLAFGVLASAAYAGSAFAQAGPPERDTRGMGKSLGIGEGWVGALVLAPAALDTYRYYRPGARWAKHASRALKLGLVLLVLKAGA